jgi:hypothetical protein
MHALHFVENHMVENSVKNTYAVEQVNWTVWSCFTC